MSLTSLFPNQKPALSLDFANSKQIDPRVICTRTATGANASYTGAGGKVEYAAADQPRIHHNYYSRRNLFTHSQNLDNASWYKGRVNVTANTTATTSPNGAQSAELLVENNSSQGEHYVTQEPDYVSGRTYTWSFWAKPAGRKHVYVKSYGAFPTTRSIIDLESGLRNDIDVATWENYRCEKYPNGWYRLSFTRTATSTAAGTMLIGFAQDINTYNYTGDNSSGMYFWGCQLEEGSESTPYIKTGVDAVTVTEWQRAGILTEQSTTNMVDSPMGTGMDGSWSHIGLTSSTNVDGPDGVNLSAFAFQEGTTNPGQHTIYRDVTVTDNADNFTYSVFVKPVDRHEFQLMIHNLGTPGADNISLRFNSKTEAVTLTTNTGVSNVVDGGFIPFANGWYRLWITGSVGNSNTTSTMVRIHVRSEVNGATSYTGGGGVAFHGFGCQMEEKPFLTSLVKSAPFTTATRGRDHYYITGLDTASWFNSSWTKMSMVYDWDFPYYNLDPVTHGSIFGHTAFWSDSTSFDDRVSLAMPHTNADSGVTRAFESGNAIFANGTIPTGGGAESTKKIGWTWDIADYSDNNSKQWSFMWKGGDSLYVVPGTTNGQEAPGITRLGIGTNPTRFDESPGAKVFKTVRIYNAVLNTEQMTSMIK